VSLEKFIGEMLKAIQATINYNCTSKNDFQKKFRNLFECC